jgi:hypothetical protein
VTLMFQTVCQAVFTAVKVVFASAWISATVHGPLVVPIEKCQIRANGLPAIVPAVFTWAVPGTRITVILPTFPIHHSGE